MGLLSVACCVVLVFIYMNMCVSVCKKEKGGGYKLITCKFFLSLHS